MKKSYCIVGPAPVTAVPDIMTQIEDSKGWMVRFVSFAGMMQSQPSLALPGQVGALPAYVIIACADEVNGALPEPPKIEIRKRKDFS
jgi:hypothetical protein